MTDKEKIKELLEASPDGTITAEQVTAAGLHRSILQELVENGELYRFGRGLYVRSNAWEDDFYLLQRKYGRGIYSHDTALYLLGYSDRTPAQYTMTFPRLQFAVAETGKYQHQASCAGELFFWVIELRSPAAILSVSMTLKGRCATSRAAAAATFRLWARQ